MRRLHRLYSLFRLNNVAIQVCVAAIHKGIVLQINNNLPHYITTLYYNPVNCYVLIISIEEHKRDIVLK